MPLPITVLVSVSTFSPVTNGAYGVYLIHRNDEFNVDCYEYFAMSTNSSEHNIAMGTRSTTLLVGNFDETIVRITPTQNISLPQDAQNSGLVNVTAGSSHSVTLHGLQTLLLSSPNDLTGTRIVSDKPLTVLTGHDCGQIPSTRPNCEPMYVHAAPKINWGKEFLLAPFNGNISPQYYKFVTSQDITTVAYRCNNQSSESMEISGAGEGTLLAFPPNSLCSLVSSGPIFVVHLRASRRLGDTLGDPYITTVSPTTGYVNNISFTNLESPTIPDNFFIVTVQAEHFDQTQILLDGTQLSCSWTTIRSIYSDRAVGYGCTVAIASRVHVVSHSEENGLLSVVTYGYASNTLNQQRGYAYLAGINLDITTETEGK